MEKDIFFIVLGICLIELVVIFALLNKKKPMHVAILIAITFGIVGLIYTYQNRNSIFKHSEKNISQADQMYYEEMFPQPKMNLIGKKPFTIIPAYDERFILMHPELKEYFLCKVPAERIFSTKLNIDFADGTWQLSVNKHTDEIVRAQFSKDGKYVLVSGIKEGTAVIDISREDEIYGGSIFVRVEKPEEWYEKLQEEMKFQHLPMPTSQKEEVKYLYPNTINRIENFPDSFFASKTGVSFEVLENDNCIVIISKGRAFTPGKKSNQYRLKIDESRNERRNEQILDYFICPYSEFNKALEVFYEKNRYKKATVQYFQN